MTLTNEEFHAKLEGCIETLVALSLFATNNDERVTHVYIFVGLEDSGVYRPYFKVNNQICSLYTLDESLGKNRRPESEDFEIQHAGLVQARELMQLFVESDRECPYELKVVYNCGPGSLDFAFSYDPPTEPGSTRGSADAWLKSLCAGDDPLPNPS